MELDRSRGGEDLRGVGGKKTIIRKYYMKKNLFQNTEKIYI